MQRYLIIVEQAAANFSAWSPDLPGCVATGATRDETLRNMHDAINWDPTPFRHRDPVGAPGHGYASRGAIEMHIEGLRADNLPVPEATSLAEYVTV